MKNNLLDFNYLNPRRVVLFFIVANFLFLILDILLAHSYNHFESIGEWIPIGYSAVAGIGLFLYAALGEKPSPLQRTTMHVILWLGVAVGFLGFYFHFSSATLKELSLKSLVYAAPLAAPLAYSGLSLVALITDGLGLHFGEFRKRILLILTSGGFAGNLILSILDHARNGFFVKMEWVPVFVSAFVFIVFLWAGLKKTLSEADMITVHLAIGVAIVTGIAGFAFHLGADIHGFMPNLLDRFIYGAPVFAPLLFCDIAVLGLLAMLMRNDFSDWLDPSS